MLEGRDRGAVGRGALRSDIYWLCEKNVKERMILFFSSGLWMEGVVGVGGDSIFSIYGSILYSITVFAFMKLGHLTFFPSWKPVFHFVSLFFSSKGSVMGQIPH